MRDRKRSCVRSGRGIPSDVSSIHPPPVVYWRPARFEQSDQCATDTLRGRSAWWLLELLEAGVQNRPCVACSPNRARDATTDVTVAQAPPSRCDLPEHRCVAAALGATGVVGTGNCDRTGCCSRVGAVSNGGASFGAAARRYGHRPRAPGSDRVLVCHVPGVVGCVRWKASTPAQLLGSCDVKRRKLAIAAA